MDVNELEFIEIFKQYPCLYNKKLVEYRNRNRRLRAVTEIAEKFSTTIGKSAYIGITTNIAPANTLLLLYKCVLPS